MIKVKVPGAMRMIGQAKAQAQMMLTQVSPGPADLCEEGVEGEAAETAPTAQCSSSAWSHLASPFDLLDHEQ